MTTITEFAAGLKEHLQVNATYAVVEGRYYSTLTGSDPSEVDWDELNKEIDAFCASFKAKRASDGIKSGN